MLHGNCPLAEIILLGPKLLSVPRPAELRSPGYRPSRLHLARRQSHNQWNRPPLRSGNTFARAAAADSHHGPERLHISLGGREIILETGEIGRQANGAILATDGETVLYTTACCEGEPTDQGGFAPFSVTYSERFSAAGRTSGSFFRREGRPQIHEMVTSRLTDRPLRPMLPKEWDIDTQVLSWLMSYDGEHQPDALAITAAGAALVTSDIPLLKSIAGVTVGLVDGKFIVNPTAEEESRSSLDLIMAGTADAILMIEGFCNFLSEEQLLEALRVGSEAISHICSEVQAWSDQFGTEKRTDRTRPENKFEAHLLSDQALGESIRETYRKSLGKHERAAAVAEIREQAGSKAFADRPESEVLELRQQYNRAFKRLENKVMRELALDEGIRADGRGLTEVRPISSRCGLLPRTHGSVLFTRGETQAIAVTTLGPSEMALKQDHVATREDGPRRFYLQYSFPPSSVGETGRMGGPGRREVGHGMLAERALQPIIPDEDAFPYTIRVESTITESNGSSSMASVCGGCLSLQDAGVPIKRPVAGVAMGLILAEDGKGYKILTDILGSEDALGDMDFKVAGDADGVTAFQMDIKVEGISLEILGEALQHAKTGRKHVLQEMAKCSPPPRNALGPYTPHILRVRIDPTQIGQIIGSGGKTIRSVREDSGCTSLQLVDDVDGVFEIMATTSEAAAKTKDMILSLVQDPEVDSIYRGVKIVGIEKFGMFVEFLPNRTGLLHFSELASGEDLNDFDLGDEIDVILLAIDPSGKFKLSRKAIERASVETSSLDQPPSPPKPAPGSVCKNAKIVDVKPYGVFVEVFPGFSGLVHTSELWTSGESHTPFAVGDVIPVLVLQPRDGKQAFSRKQALNNAPMEQIIL